MDRSDGDRLEVILIHFDARCAGRFKYQLRRVHDYPLLNCYLKSMLSLSGIGETVNMAHIKQRDDSIKALNLNGMVTALF